MNRKHLKLLADYLYALPDDYEHFEMLNFFNLDGGNLPLLQVSEVSLHDCGTAACAIGHAPFVDGIPKPDEEDEYWVDYSERIFEISGFDDKWEFMFGSVWSYTDNTPKGAAKRIYWVLDGNTIDLEDMEYTDYSQQLPVEA